MDIEEIKSRILICEKKENDYLEDEIKELEKNLECYHYDEEVRGYLIQRRSDFKEILKKVSCKTNA